ncbi:MAG TPA: helix-turn-helix domain-containing protein [Smithellaceae bacterium]|jgi:DnaJ-class molecular chaperone|nr:DnaJ domain-containing protein [Smithella sp.]HNZ10282.1 helix-turn-helix domain-containing protein [Smithellaceae bacterium]HOG81454.1 helix-turn-helix domain-containing protein [Smithellaceae bacterium]HOQ41466.1 helix-turn-helix domain-containing protein [Smithellaceae bacterium]HPL65581.1 helix-turn-helix domain-containing protein [Smithellaceae bacterium]
MRKDFNQLNYYEMLDLQPNAVPYEIRHAYNAAMQLYQPGSLVSYSFFSEKERREILALIEKAYQTLINDQLRKEYDDELVRRGEIEAKEETAPEVKKPVSVFHISRGPTARTVFVSSDALKDRISQSQVIKDILAQSVLSGQDLKQIRTELGLTIEQIAEETKIRVNHIQSIEEGQAQNLPPAVFLKGFVKSYLKCLGLESVDELSARYMNTVSCLK